MSNKTSYTLVVTLIAASVVFWVFMFQNNSAETTQQETYMNDEIKMTMYHSPGCQCCVKWAAYLEENGIDVAIEQTNNLYDIKQEHGVPNQLSSCHTAVVEGYVVEGHVPVEDIRRLLTERPDVIGISVPGMPPNSPGMDIPSSEAYQSVLFDSENITVFNTHN